MTIARALAILLTTTVATTATMMPAPAMAQDVSFAIPAGTLRAALRAWSRQSGRELLYRDDDLGDTRSKGASGAMTAEVALGQILSDTGFVVTFDSSGAVAIVREAPEGNATPDILVTGKRNWSLNTGIARSRDDSQPFIVMTDEDIKKSGAPDLDTFLRNQLNVNSSSSVGDQAGRANFQQRGISRINLRGLGARETLILVDGRRQPGINLGDGQMNQPQITGIPLAAIERIEVLASSASGIYGSGATGGVINIVLKRGYQGGELTASYANTSDFAQGDGRIDLMAAKTLEGGKTNVSFTGSWRKQLPLYYGDRAELLARGRNAILANDPTAFETIGAPAAATPNFASTDGSPLALKPQYGGTVFGSSIGHVPDGYRGLATDGVAPLVGTIGRYAFTQPDSATGEGRRAPLLYGTESISGMLSVRREFNPWLTIYAEGAASRVLSRTVVTRALAAFDLSADAPNNPFAQDIHVTLPQGDAEANVTSRNDQLRGVLGAIIKLPYKWQALADLSWSQSRFVADRTPSNTSPAFTQALVEGDQDALRDLRQNPLRYDYIDSGFGSLTTPAMSRVMAASLRLAGPLPLKLPGGTPQMTVNLEHSREVSGASIAAINGVFSTVSYTPRRAQTISSVYGEVAFPIVGDTNHVPFVHLLELRLSARHEEYRGDGAVNSVMCQFALGPLPNDDIFTGCPPAGSDLSLASARNSHTDPSISMRWAPIPDITFRASFTTGYLPPRLDQLTRVAGALSVSARDPLRGGELIGTPTPDGNEIPGYSGGNNGVKPEASTTWTAGVILTPRFLSGLRLSVDWTRIRKHDNYFDPLVLLNANGDPTTQKAFEMYISKYPDRVVRGPASGGFSVGPITSLDMSLANILGSKAEAVDFALDYSDRLFGGTVELASTATWVRVLTIDTFPGVAPEDYTGVNTAAFGQGYSDNGALRWRGNASVRWSKGPFAVSWQTRYTDGYYLELDRSYVARQGSARVPSQTYHDIAASYSLPQGMTIRAGINNVFGTKPPIDTYASPVFYSRYGDPRLTNFYLTVSKSF